MAVYPQIKYDPKLHRPWLERVAGDSEWWRIRSVNYGDWQLGGSSYHDIAYSENPEELILWADLNGVPIAKPKKFC